MEKAKFYSQCNFEKWLNYLIWNLIIPVSLPQKIIINLGYVEWKFATPIVKSLVKALKKELQWEVSGELKWKSYYLLHL